jgi:hypothetical protein
VVGRCVGIELEDIVGAWVGTMEGGCVGIELGDSDGLWVGTREGCCVGAKDIEG